MARWGIKRQEQVEPKVLLYPRQGKAYEEVQLEIESRLDQPCLLVPQRLRWMIAPHKGREHAISVEIKGNTQPYIEIPPHPHRSTLTVRLNYAGLAPKQMYTLTVRPAPDAFLLGNRPLPVRAHALTFYLPALLKPPQAVVGQTFVCLPHFGQSAFPYRDERNQFLDWRKVALRVWRLTRVEPDRLEFAIEGLSLRAWCRWEGDMTALPGLLPIVEEPTARRLQARYEGRHVWGYGGIGAIALMSERRVSAAFGFERLKPARILLLRRVWLPWMELELGSALYTGGRMYTFLTHHPLFVRLQPEGKAIGGSASLPAEALLPDVMDEPRRYALGFYAWHADEWDFERAYSVQNPLALAKRWSAQERRALHTGELQRGLSHEVVAWIWGWPCLYGTKEELKRLNEWIYENVPFEATLTFRNGRLVHWDIPRLP